MGRVDDGMVVAKQLGRRARSRAEARRAVGLAIVVGGAVLSACGGTSAPRSAPTAERARSTPVRRASPPLPPRPTYVGPGDSTLTGETLDSLWARQLMVPVEGMLRRTLRDTYTAARTGKIHGALDIPAPRSTPVLAPDDITIGRLFKGPVGGTVIYATDPSGRFVYYFAHLDRYRRGLAVGDRVAKGSLIAYVGSTGNASPQAPHLHFQVMRRGPRVWWDGPALNPFSLFALDGLRPAPRAKAPIEGS